MRTPLLLSAFLLAAIIPLAHATTGCNAVGWDDTFLDNQGCDLYYPAIRWMEDKGIAEGYPDPEHLEGRWFRPFKTINRAEFTKLTLLAGGLELKECAVSPFPDVPKTAWFARYVCAAKDAGIISGFPDGTFKPDIDVNFANAAKILANTFKLPVDHSPDEIWYRKYTEALRAKGAIAETVEGFDALLTRGEMAEMLFRLATGDTSIKSHPVETELDGMGLGYLSYMLEDALGITVEPPDSPFVFYPERYDIGWLIDRPASLPGYAFAHVLQEVKCTESGLWEHCKPLFVDWKIGLYEAAGDNDELDLDYALRAKWGEPTIERFFGGVRADCYALGVEGENTEVCVVDHPVREGLLVVRESVDTDVTYWDTPGITPIKTSDAWYARIRKSMQFLSY